MRLFIATTAGISGNSDVMVLLKVVSANVMSGDCKVPVSNDTSGKNNSIMINSGTNRNH